MILNKFNILEKFDITIVFFFFYVVSLSISSVSMYLISVGL